MSNNTIRLYTLEQAEEILQKRRARKMRWYKKQLKRKIRRVLEDFMVWAAPKVVGGAFFALAAICWQLEEIAICGLIFALMGVAVLFCAGNFYDEGMEEE